MKQFIYALVLVCALTLSHAPQALAETRPAASQAAVATINVNTATSKELQSLPGVGKVTAENIIAYRGANGPFKNKEDLRKVKGIGEKTLEKLRQLIVVQ